MPGIVKNSNYLIIVASVCTWAGSEHVNIEADVLEAGNIDKLKGLEKRDVTNENAKFIATVVKSNMGHDACNKC